MLKNKMARLFLVVGLVVTIAACEEDPTSVGASLFDNTFKIVEVSSDSLNQTTSEKSDSISFGLSTRLLLGKYKNVRSDMMVKYLVYFPDSLKDAFNNGEITFLNAMISLEPGYRIGDAAGVFDFSVHNINQSWTTAGFDRDTLAALDYDPADISSVKSITDTLITFDISTDVVKTWLDKKLNEGTDDNNGLFYQASDAATRIFGFGSVNNSNPSHRSKIRLIYETAANDPDTLTFDQYIDVHIVNGTMPAPDPTYYYLQGGIPSRMNLKFDLSQLTKDMVIQEAELSLFTDSLASDYGNVKSDTIYAYMYADSLMKEVTTDIQRLTLTRSGNEYKGSATRAIHLWKNGIENRGFRIQLSDEIRSVNKVAIYNSNQALRPKLTFTYTVD